MKIKLVHHFIYYILSSTIFLKTEGFNNALPLLDKEQLKVNTMFFYDFYCLAKI